MCAAAIAGTVLGLIAGSFGGWIDDAVMRITDALMSVPALMVIAILVLTVGKDLWALSVLVAVV